LLGGFFLAAAMTKTKLDEQLLKLTLKISGTKPRNIVIAFMFTAMVLLYGNVSYCYHRNDGCRAHAFIDYQQTRIK
jgi:di/tricarboxylate transporter